MPARLEFLKEGLLKELKELILKNNDKVISLTVLNHVETTSEETKAYIKRTRKMI